MRSKHQVVLLALLAFGLLIAPITARAGTNLGMQFSTGGAGNVVVCDNNASFTSGGTTCMNTAGANDASGATGAITWIGSIGGWNMNITSGTQSPLGNLTPLLDISYNDVANRAGANPLTILLTVTGLTSPINLSALNSLGGTTTPGGTTLTTQAWIDIGDKVFCASGCGTALTSLLALTGNPYSGMAGGTGVGNNTGYSITLELTIDPHGAANSTTGDDQLDIPEPATLTVLGVGLLALGTGLRKKLLQGKI